MGRPHVLRSKSYPEFHHVKTWRGVQSYAVLLISGHDIRKAYIIQKEGNTKALDSLAKWLDAYRNVNHQIWLLLALDPTHANDLLSLMTDIRTSGFSMILSKQFKFKRPTAKMELSTVADIVRLFN